MQSGTDEVLDKFCTKRTSSKVPPFRDLLAKTEIQFDAFRVHSSAPEIGEGSFGIVTKAPYPSSGSSRLVALKIVETDVKKNFDALGLELTALVSVANSPYFAHLIGCVTNDDHKAVLVQTLCSHTLSDKKFLVPFASQTAHQSIVFFRKIFLGLRDLWNQGFAHCDFKPQNVMTDSTNTDPYIIDLGLVQRVGEVIQTRGNFPYKSPAKRLKETLVAPKDDWYAVAMTVVFTKAGKPSAWFPKMIDPKTGEECDADGWLSTDCRLGLARNVGRVLASHGFGEVQPSFNKDTVNFSSLMVAMVEYDALSLDYDQLIAILDRLVEAHAAHPTHKHSPEEVAKYQKTGERIAKILQMLAVVDPKLIALDLQINAKEKTLAQLKEAKGGNEAAIKTLQDELEVENEVSKQMFYFRVLTNGLVPNHPQDDVGTEDLQKKEEQFRSRWADDLDEKKGQPAIQPTVKRRII